MRTCLEGRGICQCQSHSCLQDKSAECNRARFLGIPTLRPVSSGDLAHLALAGLKIRKVTGLIVDVHDLLITLLVEHANTLTRWCAKRFLEVGAESLPALLSTLRDTVLLVHSLGALGSLVFAVKLKQGLVEAAADSVLLVESKSSFDSFVADRVTVRKIFSNDARAGLVLLLKIVSVICSTSRSASSSLIE